MKKNINIFNKGLEKQFETQMQEFAELKEKTKEYLKKLEREKEEILRQEKNKYIEIINTMIEIRDKKKEEINSQIVISQNKIKKLNKRYQTLASNYCEEHGHKFAYIDYKFKHDTGKHSFYGDESIYEFLAKCQICGQEESFRGSFYGGNPRMDNYEVIIPDELKAEYQEIQALEEYISYLEYLKTKICKIFGHDFDLTYAIIWYDDNNTLHLDGDIDCICDFCGKFLDEEDWKDPDSLYNYGIVMPKSKEDLSLPSFEDYQRKLKK